MNFRNLIIASALATAGCSDRVPTGPGRPVMGATAGSATLRAEVKNAVDDSRLRIMPVFSAAPTLGALQATTDLSSALDDLAAALAQPRGSLDTPIRRARKAITTLENAVRSDAGRAADLTVVRLAVERVADVGKSCC